MENAIYVSGSNYFNNKDLQKMITLLDNKQTIHIGIECIGHTRNNIEQEEYKKALSEHYGNRLEIIKSNGVYSYSYSYKLN